jgi:hypothetical protein
MEGLHRPTRRHGLDVSEPTIRVRTVDAVVERRRTACGDRRDAHTDHMIPHSCRAPVRVLLLLRRSAKSATPSSQPQEARAVYSVHHIETREPIGPARSLDHALILADANGSGRYEVVVVGDLLTHLCVITRHEDGTFTVDPRRAGGLMAVLGNTLTRA